MKNIFVWKEQKKINTSYGCWTNEMYIQIFWFNWRAVKNNWVTYTNSQAKEFFYYFKVVATKKVKIISKTFFLT